MVKCGARSGLCPGRAGGAGGAAARRPVRRTAGSQRGRAGWRAGWRSGGGARRHGEARGGACDPPGNTGPREDAKKRGRQSKLQSTARQHPPRFQGTAAWSVDFGKMRGAVGAMPRARRGRGGSRRAPSRPPDCRLPKGAGWLAGGVAQWRRGAAARGGPGGSLRPPGKHRAA